MQCHHRWLPRCGAIGCLLASSRCSSCPSPSAPSWSCWLPAQPILCRNNWEENGITKLCECLFFSPLLLFFSSFLSFFLGGKQQKKTASLPRNNIRRIARVCGSCCCRRRVVQRGRCVSRNYESRRQEKQSISINMCMW